MVGGPPGVRIPSRPPPGQREHTPPSNIAAFKEKWSLLIARGVTDAQSWFRLFGSKIGSPGTTPARKPRIKRRIVLVTMET